MRSPLREKLSAARQASVARDVEGTLEVFPEYEHALSDLEGMDRLWILYWFDRAAEASRMKVLPPRSDRRRGVFATRSPHRPNPIGLSCVRLAAVSGLVLHLRDVDMLDGTPVLDIKPYLPYADAFPDARTGWLEPARDPIAAYSIVWSPRAQEQTRWLADVHGIDLVSPIEAILALGPQPHPYRRIKKHEDGFRLAYKEWRVFFRSESQSIVIETLASGYRPSQLAAETAPVVHRAFVLRFP